VRLTVTTPLAIVIEVSDVVHLRAEDETGAFGILPGHADFLTALAVSVTSWRDERGLEHYVAVRGGRRLALMRNVSILRQFARSRAFSARGVPRRRLQCRRSGPMTGSRRDTGAYRKSIQSS